MDDLPPAALHILKKRRLALQLDDAAAFPSDLSRPDAVDILEKRRLVVEDSAARVLFPSDLARPKYFRELNPSRFALHRPPTHAELPLALLHPIFAEFVADVKHHEPTPEDYTLVQELRKVMSEPWDDEMQTSYEFRMILGKHYDIELYPARVAATNRMSNGHAIVGGYIYVVFGIKDWKGERDPEVHASLFTLEALRAVIQKGKDPHDLFPCIIIYCVGTLIGFSGTVLTDRFQLEPLTACFPVHTNVHEPAIATELARAFGAFRIAVDKLRVHYKNLISRSLQELQAPERVLRITFPYPESYGTEDGEIKFTYDCRLNDGKLIFLATTTGGTKVLIKFTRRYSKQAHQHCAEAGVAPNLLGFESLPTGWYMVVMEYLDPQTYRTLRPEDGSNSRLIEEIKRAVTVLHGGGFVHGDVRDINFMTRHQWSAEEKVRNVFLVDFDWAGVSGIAKYPRLVNRETVQRPEGAEDGELITQEHDWAMVGYILDYMRPL